AARIVGRHAPAWASLLDKPMAQQGNRSERATFFSGIALDDHFGGCLFTTSSLMSAPQPGFVGMIRWPFSMRGGAVTRSSFQGTSSMSISMMRKFGIAAQKWALISVDMWPFPGQVDNADVHGIILE